tara:strand:+ start:62 stop:361 length:300 start_codon:yes stop_codon:yes gene_type:complete
MTQEATLDTALSPQEEFDRINAQITSIIAQQAELEDRANLLNDQKQQLVGIRNYIMQKAQAAQAQNLADLDANPLFEDVDEEEDDLDSDSVLRSAEYPE